MNNNYRFTFRKEGQILCPSTSIFCPGEKKNHGCWLQFSVWLRFMFISSKLHSTTTMIPLREYDVELFTHVNRFHIFHLIHWMLHCQPQTQMWAVMCCHFLFYNISSWFICSKPSVFLEAGLLENWGEFQYQAPEHNRSAALASLNNVMG